MFSLSKEEYVWQNIPYRYIEWGIAYNVLIFNLFYYDPNINPKQLKTTFVEVVLFSLVEAKAEQ